MRLKARLVSDDMIALKQAAIDDLGVVARLGYVRREDEFGKLSEVATAWMREKISRAGPAASERLGRDLWQAPDMASRQFPWTIVFRTITSH